MGGGRYGPYWSTEKNTVKDHQYILTVTDLFTKWVIAEPLKCGSSTEVAEALVSKLYTFGMVRKIITDRAVHLLTRYVS